MLVIWKAKYLILQKNIGFQWQPKLIDKYRG